MRVLVLYAHPVESSYNAALHKAAVDALAAAGHEVDDCDLYAEGFNPVLSRDERLNYHNEGTCTVPVQSYVDRVRAADALVLCTPVWNFGYPAILKGFFDRVFLPGVSFKLVDGKTRPNLGHIRKIAAVTTYGGNRLRALAMGDPPRKVFKRVLRVLVSPTAEAHYLALYDMNRNSPQTLTTFLQHVSTRMRAF